MFRYISSRYLDLWKFFHLFLAGSLYNCSERKMKLENSKDSLKETRTPLQGHWAAATSLQTKESSVECVSEWLIMTSPVTNTNEERCFFFFWCQTWNKPRFTMSRGRLTHLPLPLQSIKSDIWHKRDFFFFYQPHRRAAAAAATAVLIVLLSSAASV